MYIATYMIMHVISACYIRAVFLLTMITLLCKHKYPLTGQYNQQINNHYPTYIIHS